MENVRKAVFPVAGFGTRFLPATKAMPKELLPIINKPLIQFAAEEAVAAGIDTLISVTGKNKRAMEDHFDRNIELENALNSSGQSEKVEIIKNILPSQVECIFVRQAEQRGLGHAIMCAERVVGEEPFAVLLADDFIINTEKQILAELKNAFIMTGKTQIAALQIDGPDLSKYGVIVRSKDGSRVTNLIEKPDYHKAPSNLASIGRYVLHPSIFKYLKDQKVGYNEEIQLADAINVQAEDGLVEAIDLSGKRFDCGHVEGYLQAIMHVSKNI